MNDMVNAFRSHRASIWLLLGLNVAFYIAMQFPVLSLLFTPLDSFVTTLHEMGHATACVLTGGKVFALTIVPDGGEAAGLTYCAGGNQFFVIPAGYLGAALDGCALIWLGRDDNKSKPLLMVLGVLIAIGSIFWMGAGLTFSRIGSGQAFESILLGLVIAGALFAAGYFMKPLTAHLFVLVLGGQTALNAIRDIFTLIRIHMGYNAVAHSDAYNFSRLVGLTPTIWSLVFCAVAIAMVVATLKLAYGSKQN